MSFLITGLPRSRTAWFSAYFSACGHPCIHEGMKYCDSITQYNEFISYWEGNSDCGGVHYQGGRKTVVIEREPDDVYKSLINMGFEKNQIIDTIDNSFEKMRDIDGFHVKYDDINDKLPEIHEFCVDSPYNQLIGEQYKNMRVSIMNPITHNPKILGELLCLG